MNVIRSIAAVTTRLRAVADRGDPGGLVAELHHHAAVDEPGRVGVADPHPLDEDGLRLEAGFGSMARAIVTAPVARVIALGRWPEIACSAPRRGGWSRCRRCPRLVEWREEVGRRPAAALSRARSTGRGRCRGSATRARRVVIVGLGARRPRRQPDRAHVHRRSLGRLALRGAAPGRVREPGPLGAPRRRAAAARRLRDRGQPLRRRPATGRRPPSATTASRTWSRSCGCSSGRG